MTNKEDDGETTCDQRLASLLAVHLVSQVLEEAAVNVIAAKESGQPWCYLTMLKNLRSNRLGEIDDNVPTHILCSQSAEDNVNINKTISVTNVVATSTPQKNSDVPIKYKKENDLIGQGDEDFDMQQNELSKSTSMFINHLFDMSEVERVIICDDTTVTQNNPEPNDLLIQAVTKIMESYVDTALNIVFGEETKLTNTQVETEKSSMSTEYSSYSFLGDAFTVNASNNVVFYINDEINSNIENNEASQYLAETPRDTADDQNLNEKIENDDIAFYEKSYLSLNRDYDQCSEEDCYPILQTSKGLSMQEVELLTTHTSEENLSLFPELEQKSKELAATSAVSALTNGSRKSNLVRRCRMQGARLLACLRGWWRRRAPTKRKEARHGTDVPAGVCPLDKGVRRRTGSLLETRHLRSPSPTHSAAWKYNTVTEALVNAARWKEYIFEMKQGECSEY